MLRSNRKLALHSSKKAVPYHDIIQVIIKGTIAPTARSVNDSRFCDRAVNVGEWCTFFLHKKAFISQNKQVPPQEKGRGREPHTVYGNDLALFSCLQIPYLHSSAANPDGNQLAVL